MAPETEASFWIAPFEFEETMNRSELAEFFGADPTTIDRWVRRGMPREDSGGRGKPSVFNLGKVRRWLAEREGDPLR